MYEVLGTPLSEVMGLVDLKQAMMKFAAALAFESEKEVIAFVRGYLNAQLKNVTATAVADAIKTDYNLLPNIKINTKKAMLDRAMKNPVVAKLVNREKARITHNLVLEWLRVDRPDIASVIINYPEGKGMNWLEVQVAKIKAELFGNE
jgi:hypothetical protein